MFPLPFYPLPFYRLPFNPLPLTLFHFTLFHFTLSHLPYSKPCLRLSKNPLPFYYPLPLTLYHLPSSIYPTQNPASASAKTLFRFTLFHLPYSNPSSASANTLSLYIPSTMYPLPKPYLRLALLRYSKPRGLRRKSQAEAVGPRPQAQGLRPVGGWGAEIAT